MPSRAKRIVRNKYTGRLSVEDPIPRSDKKKCAVCKKPMLVAMGQIAKYHKECRKLRHNKSNKK